MIRLNILAVGKLKERYLKEAVAEYQKRIGRFASLEVIEVPDAPDDAQNAERQKEQEGERLLKHIKGYCVLLDLTGKTVTSEELAKLIESSAVCGASELTFVIGGSRGVCPAVKTRADSVVSFGSITFPHQLIRVVLAEQLYRAMTILNNTGYHK